jgi:hypothetical protein
MFLLYDGPADRMSHTYHRPSAAVVDGSWFEREKWPGGCSAIFHSLWPILRYGRCLLSAVLSEKDSERAIYSKMMAVNDNQVGWPKTNQK